MPHHVQILLFEGVQSLDVTGPLEVFTLAGHYRVTTAGPGGVPVRTSSGLRLTPDAALAEPTAGTLVVPGGAGTRESPPEVIAWLQDHGHVPSRVMSVCTGAFLLAEAGLLDGRRATTHWQYCDSLAGRHPRVDVDPEPIFVSDGGVWTSAGVTAGMDLTLALVENDHGHALALAVARELVLFLRRPGDQKQFSTVLAAQSAPSLRLGDLLAWINENLDRNLSVPELAARACLSPRQFARAFRDETGTTPARMVEQMRVEAARRTLESGRTALGQVARSCGFQTEETMRRSFIRHVGVPPGDYRDRFRRWTSVAPSTANREEEPRP